MRTAASRNSISQMSQAKGAPTFTNRRLYLMRCAALPFGFFFLSAFATFGVWPRTLPARAKDPCTLPATHEQQAGQA